eukprot:992676-Amphidinium_carterae.1
MTQTMLCPIAGEKKFCMPIPFKSFRANERNKNHWYTPFCSFYQCGRPFACNATLVQKLPIECGCALKVPSAYDVDGRRGLAGYPGAFNALARHERTLRLP